VAKSNIGSLTVSVIITAESSGFVPSFPKASSNIAELCIYIHNYVNIHIHIHIHINILYLYLYLNPYNIRTIQQISSLTL